MCASTVPGGRTIGSRRRRLRRRRRAQVEFDISKWGTVEDRHPQLGVS